MYRTRFIPELSTTRNSLGLNRHLRQYRYRCEVDLFRLLVKPVPWCSCGTSVLSVTVKLPCGAGLYDAIV